MSQLLSRRDILGLACGALLARSLAACSSRPTPAGGLWPPGGCFIAPEQFASLTVWNPQQITFLSSSGTKSFDTNLGQALVALSSELAVNPGFYYYTCTSRSENAYADWYTWVPDTRGTVWLGLDLLDTLLYTDSREEKPDGDIAILAVCAHEFAHIHQYFYKKTDMMRRLSSLPEYCRELYADFLAGYFLRLFHSERPQIGVQGVGRAWEKDLRYSEFNEPNTHGTRPQRLSALESGYSHAQQRGRNLDAAAAAAYQHVLTSTRAESGGPPYCGKHY